MKTIKFIILYIFDGNFRHWVNLKSEQKYVNDIQNTMIEKSEYESRRIFITNHNEK